MTNYPNWAAGDPITADWLNHTQGFWFYKASDLTRTSTVTLADDPDLTMELDANAVYWVEFNLLAGATNAEDFRSEWGVPSGATGFKECWGPSETVTTNSTGDANLVRLGVHGFTTDIIYGGIRNANNLFFSAREFGLVHTTSAGTLVFRWAQGTSGATGTVLAADSSLHVKRIA